MAQMVLLLLFTPIAENRHVWKGNNKNEERGILRHYNGAVHCATTPVRPYTGANTKGLWNREVRGAVRKKPKAIKFHPSLSLPPISSPSSSLIQPIIRPAESVVFEEGEMLSFNKWHGWWGAEQTLKLSHHRTGRAGDGNSSEHTWCEWVRSLNYLRKQGGENKRKEIK